MIIIWNISINLSNLKWQNGYFLKNKPWAAPDAMTAAMRARIAMAIFMLKGTKLKLLSQVDLLWTPNSRLAAWTEIKGKGNWKAMLAIQTSNCECLSFIVSGPIYSFFGQRLSKTDEAKGEADQKAALGLLTDFIATVLGVASLLALQCIGLLTVST